MKTIIRSLPGKITLFILCILLLAISIGGALGTWVMVEEDFYRHSREQLLENIQHNLILNDVYDLMDFTLSNRSIVQSYNPYAKENTNLRYLITTTDGTPLRTNDPDRVNMTDRSQWPFLFAMAYNETEYRCYADLADGLPVHDQYAVVTYIFSTFWTLRYWLPVIAFLALLLCVICYITLLCCAGRRPHSEALHPGPLHWMPFDVLLFCVAAVFVLLAIFLDMSFNGDILFWAVLLLSCIITVCAFIGLSMSLAIRVKAHNLLANTLLWRFLALGFRVCRSLFCFLRELRNKFIRLIRSLPMIWRTGLLVFGLGAVDFLLLALVNGGEDIALILWFLKTFVLALAMLYGALFMRKLQAGGKALAEGDLEHQVNTDMMFWDFKEHGENLNRISQGMAAAVEQRLQSERMKTELITNVSHDIKTPLTSIINYAGLIAQKTCNCEEHSSYAEVLLRKSEHLKRLLDDLVEISRASSGNLDVVLDTCDAGVLLNQISGEHQQRLTDANLELIARIPDEPVLILADSRRIWRILENLMGNVCKYSLSGSRVFLTLTKEERTACIVLRNTSGTVLNISANELMERFVRGDSARTTEGNGLGLSIAQSLTQLQGGTIDISIDGDIFKVTLRFPLANQ